MKFCLFSRKQVVGLIGIMGLLILCLRLVTISKPKPIHFETLREFKDFALAKGFFIPEQPVFMNNFFITAHPLTDDALQKLHSIDKRKCGLTPEWRGLLWVCALHSSYDSRLASDTIGGKWRTWGRLLVAGDEELMNRLEGLRRAE